MTIKRDSTSKSCFTRRAKAIFEWADEHPIAKLLVLAWVVVTSMWTFVGSCNADRREATRQGLDSDPRVIIRSTGLACTLANDGVLPLAEVTLAWRLHSFGVKPCAGRGVVDPNPLKPAAASHELRPREEISGGYALSSSLKNLCQGAAGTRVVLEWRARYFRPADMRSFEKSRFGLLDGDCTEFVPVANLISGVETETTMGVDTDTIRWRDPRDRETWSCFTTILRDPASSRRAFERFEDDINEHLLSREPTR